MTPSETAEILYAILEPFEEEPVFKRLRLRLRALGKNVLIETKQFRLLQKAANEEPALAEALETAGFGDITKMKANEVDPQAGVLVQGFNHLVEQRWEDW